MTTCIKNNSNIGLASKNDLDEINEIRTEISLDTSNDYNLGKLREDEILPMDNQKTLITKIDNHLIAFVRSYRDEIFLYFVNDWIAEMYITEKYRNKGIGSQLFKHMLNELKNNSNAKRILVGILSENTRAIEFARKHGLSFISKESKGDFWGKTLE